MWYSAFVDNVPTSPSIPYAAQVGTSELRCTSEILALLKRDLDFQEGAEKGRAMLNRKELVKGPPRENDRVAKRIFSCPVVKRNFTPSRLKKRRALFRRYKRRWFSITYLVTWSRFRGGRLTLQRRVFFPLSRYLFIARRPIARFRRRHHLRWVSIRWRREKAATRNRKGQPVLRLGEMPNGCLSNAAADDRATYYPVFHAICEIHQVQSGWSKSCVASIIGCHVSRTGISRYIERKRNAHHVSLCTAVSKIGVPVQQGWANTIVMAISSMNAINVKLSMNYYYRNLCRVS